jgi:futalosine hydrolase
VLAGGGMACRRGTFVTVSCVSGTSRRGDLLARQHQGLCENMEGAAAARVCREFGLPLLEMRCVSNLVEERDLRKWRLREACDRCGEAAALLLQGLPHD